jgi:alkylated DNA repair dioxygenase AlkB
VTTRPFSCQESLFEDASLQTFELSGAELVLLTAVWSRVEGDRLCKKLIGELDWRQDKISMFGQSHDVPRLNAWYGDPGRSYSWSGIAMDPSPWTSTLHEVKKRVSELADTEFNSVLANLYRDGNDKVDWHADDEEVLGVNPVIASVSLGAARKFRIRRKDRSSQPIDISLKSGDVLIMSGSTQRYWEHQVPRTKKVTEPRVNLTFRKVTSSA